MRSDRLLHSETVQFEPSCFVVFPTQRSLNSTRSPFGSRAADSLSSRGSRLVLVHASSVRVPPVRPKTIGAGNGGLGAARCYEAGGGRVSRRDAHFGAHPGARKAALSSAERDRDARLWHLCRLLRPCAPASRSSRGSAPVRRPPRLVPRGPRERRALSRSEMPSIGGRVAHRARTEVRCAVTSLRRSRGAHVMRIASLRRTALFSPRPAHRALHALGSSVRD